MTQISTSEMLVSVIEQQREWWETLVARTTPEQMDSVRVTEDWTIRDFAAHLLSWWEWRLTRLQAAANNEPKPDPPFPAGLESVDDQNAWFHQDTIDRSAQDLTSAFTRSFARLEQIVSTLSDAELASSSRIPFLEGKSLADSIADGSFFGHVHDEHAKEIDAWIAQTGR